MSQAAGLPVEAVRDQLQSAAAGIRAAFGAFSRHTKPVFTTTTTMRAAAPAVAGGTAARVTSIAGSASTVQATLKVNTQTSTVRSSASALGLNLTAAHSRLVSAGLGLDVTSPERASALTSTAPLGLDVVNASSTRESTAELNTATKTLDSSSLAFSAGSSRIEISGGFSGTATSLTFRISEVSSGLLGLGPKTARIDVRDQNNATIASYNGTYVDQVIDLAAIGLKVRFTEGTLVNNAVATTSVSNAPTTVATGAAFNAAWGTAPLFEDFRKVTAGSFTVNGVSIAVNANDTIDSVLSRINTSAAGVSASVTGDRVVLTSSSASESAITLGGDSSGFLQATKLSAGTTTTGNIRDDQQVLAQTTQFGSVSSGSFLVNGVAIAVDRNTDTLATVIDRISAAGAGVTAAYDAAQDRIVLTTTGNSEDPISLSGDTTGFVTAAKLSGATTVTGNVRDDVQVLSKTSQFGSVTDGTFQVNGVAIAVDADQDSISTIVQRINQSGAGVTAVFNAATNRIELESTTDSESAITVSGDSTGFLAAAGLSTANTVVGSIADDVEALAETGSFGAVTAGTLHVNGVAIAIDPEEDSLQDVITRINTAGAGVTASYDGGTDRLTFTPDTAGAALTLADDTGWLAAARVAVGAAGTRLNPDGAFDGSNGATPLFDPGVTVSAGALSVNGVSISVGAGDTVNSVLARITASGAGVTATYDSSTQLVRLTANEQSASPITLAGDTSGFLAAVKLDGSAQSTTGAASAGPFDSSLSRMAEYSGVRAGTLTINGTPIAIDPATTTLRGIVAALDSVANVDASLNEASGRITLTSTQSGGTIQLADTSGLLTALGIAAGTYSATAGGTIVTETQTGTKTTSNAAAVAAHVREAVETLGDVLTRVAQSRDGEAFSAKIVDAATDAFAGLRQAGIVGFTVGSGSPGVDVDVDRDALAGAMAKLPEDRISDAVARALDGLIERVARALEAPTASSKANPTDGTRQLRAQLTAEHAAAAVQFIETLQRAAGATSEAREVMKGPGDGALDMATRHRIRSQLEASMSSTHPALGGLFDTLLINP